MQHTPQGTIILEPRHLSHGFTELDYQEYSNLPVATANLCDFPNWEGARDGTASVWGLQPRAQAIFQFLQDRGMSADRGGLFEFKDAEAMATLAGAHVRHRSFQVGVLDANGRPVVKLNASKPLGDDQVVTTYQWWSRSPAPTIVPGFVEDIPQIITAWRITSAVVLQSSDDEKQKYSTSTRISPDLITNVPAENLGRIKTDLHEARHLRQLNLKTGNILPTYYQELDADGFMIKCFRANNIGEKTIKANLHERYLSLIQSPPQYWFAPVLDAFDNNMPLPDFYTVFDAVAQIRARLVMSWEGIPINQQPSGIDLQSAIAVWDRRQPHAPLGEISLEQIDSIDTAYVQKMRDADPCCPNEIYGPLRKLVRSGCFTDEATEVIAQKIVNAAEYFVPGVS